MATYKELQTQLDSLDRQIEEARSVELASAVAEIHRIMEEHLVEPEHLGFVRMTRLPGKKGLKPKQGIKLSLPPLYQNPNTGQTWSGRGRAPAWLPEENRERFRVRES